MPTIDLYKLSQFRTAFAEAPAIAASEARRLEAALRTAQTSEDDVSPEENQRLTGARVDAVKADATATLTRLRRDATRAKDAVDAQYETHRPRITDWAQSQTAWGRFIMQADAGRPWRVILDTADEQMLLAFEENGPAWLRSRPASTTGGIGERLHRNEAVEADVAEVPTAVRARLARTVSDPALSSLIELSVRAQDAIALATPRWNAIQQVALGRTWGALHAAAEVRMREQAIAARTAAVA